MSDAISHVKELLSQADVLTVTERKLRTQVADKLGRELTAEEIKEVKGEIDAFLTPKEPGADQTPASSSTNDVGQKRKHSPAPEILPGAKAAKAEQKAVSEGSDGSSFFLSPLKRVEVRMFKSKVLIDIRECYKDKNEDVKPGKKGLSLQVDQWLTLYNNLTALDKAFKAADTSCVVHLSDKRRATVSSFKGVVRVDIREYYEANGEWRHGQKGVGLNADEWAGLLERKEKILDAMMFLSHGIK